MRFCPLASIGPPTSAVPSSQHRSQALSLCNGGSVVPNPYTYPNTILREQQANVEPGFWGLLACGLSLAVRGYQPALQTAISHGRLRSLRSLHLSVSAPDHQGKVGCRYLRARLCSSSLLVHNFSIRRLNNRVHHQWASLQSMSAEPFLFRFVPASLVGGASRHRHIGACTSVNRSVR